jgi:hypothetical protein
VACDQKLVSNICSLLCMFFMLALTAGCSGNSANTRGSDESNPPGNLAGSASRSLDGGTYCVQTLEQGQPVSAPLHFSNKVSQSDGSLKTFEADLTADKFDVTVHERRPATDLDRELNAGKGVGPTPIVNGFAESIRTNHYSRSDASEWNMAATMVVQAGTPWGLFIEKPPVTEVGTENINGFETIKYAIDTTHQSHLEKSPMLVGEEIKDFNIIGTAWELKEKNCILQYAIDYEQEGKDGAIGKTHYEGAVAKK